MLRARTATAPRLHVRDDRDTPLAARRDVRDIARFLKKRNRNLVVAAPKPNERVIGLAISASPIFRNYQFMVLGMQGGSV